MTKLEFNNLIETHMDKIKNTKIKKTEQFTQEQMDYLKRRLDNLDKRVNDMFIKAKELESMMETLTND